MKVIRWDHEKNEKLKMHDYIHLVPFIETDDEIFLKTIIPSRKAEKEYCHE